MLLWQSALLSEVKASSLRHPAITADNRKTKSRTYFTEFDYSQLVWQPVGFPLACLRYSLWHDSCLLCTWSSGHISLRRLHFLSTPWPLNHDSSLNSSVHWWYTFCHTSMASSYFKLDSRWDSWVNIIHKYLETSVYFDRPTGVKTEVQMQITDLPHTDNNDRPVL